MISKSDYWGLNNHHQRGKRRDRTASFSHNVDTIYTYQEIYKEATEDELSMALSPVPMASSSPPTSHVSFSSSSSPYHSDDDDDEDEKNDHGIGMDMDTLTTPTTSNGRPSIDVVNLLRSHYYKSLDLLDDHDDLCDGIIDDDNSVGDRKKSLLHDSITLLCLGPSPSSSHTKSTATTKATNHACDCKLHQYVDWTSGSSMSLSSSLRLTTDDEDDDDDFLKDEDTTSGRSGLECQRQPEPKHGPRHKRQHQRCHRRSSNLALTGEEFWHKVLKEV